MAYDKVVDSAVLNAGLKSIADAIREKGETTNGLAFPAEMVEAIEAIEAGADLWGKLSETGSFTPTEDITTGYEILFGKSYVSNNTYNPTFFMWKEPKYARPTSCIMYAVGVNGKESSNCPILVYYNSSDSRAQQTSVSKSVSFSADRVTIQASTTQMLVAGETYHWLLADAAGG